MSSPQTVRIPGSPRPCLGPWDFPLLSLQLHCSNTSRKYFSKDLAVNGGLEFWLTGTHFAILENFTFISSEKQSLLIFFLGGWPCALHLQLFELWLLGRRRTTVVRAGDNHNTGEYPSQVLDTKRQGIEAVTAADKPRLTEISRYFPC